MQPTIKKEIVLNEKFILFAQETNAKIRALQEELSRTLTGVCLQEGINLATEGIQIMDNFAKIGVYDLNPEPVATLAEPASLDEVMTKKTKIRKLK